MIRKLLHLHRFRLILLNIVVILITGIGSSVEAQTVIGARELAVGQATSALHGTDWSMFGNPAMMSEDQRSVSFFGVRYFGLVDITDMAFAGSYPTKFGVVGVAAPIVSDLWIGAKATNVNQPEYGSRNNERLPRELSIGLSYQLSDMALFTSDVVKDVQFPFSYRGGVEISVIENLMGRAGITVEPLTFSGGFGYSSDFWAVNIAVQRHENKILGYSPAIDFKISW